MGAIAVAMHQKILQLILLPTEKCNFRCTYCYETFDVGKMKRPVVEGIKALIQARVDKKSIDALNVSWFGGEPLLAKDVVFEIAQFGADLQTRGQLKSFSGDLTTNGYLLDGNTLQRLCELKQSLYQVSLDGWGEGHDRTRKYASGKGTFETIWGNLLRAKKTALDFKITLRCHITKENEQSTWILVDNIISEFGGDSRFSVFFKTIENLGGPNAAAITLPDRLAAKQRVAAMSEELKAAGFSVAAVLEGPESDTGIVQPATAPTSSNPAIPVTKQDKISAFQGYICYASKPNSLVIRANGSIGKCTVLLEDERNRVGILRPDGTVEIDSHKINKFWMRGFTSLDPMELGCPAVNLPQITEKPIAFEKLAQLAPAAV